METKITARLIRKAANPRRPESAEHCYRIVVEDHVDGDVNVGAAYPMPSGGFTFMKSPFFMNNEIALYNGATFRTMKELRETFTVLILERKVAA